MPKVSVVLTTFQRARVLPATIDSILRQSFADFELIISDDCSADDTELVCRRYADSDARVRYRRNPQNLGMPGNLNAGIREAKGEFVANLHDGDEFHPRLLETWLSALENCPSAGFAFNAYLARDTDGREWLYREPLPPCGPGENLLRLFFRRWRFGSPVWGTVMVRRSAYEAVGEFDNRFGFCSDVDMWMRLAHRFPVAYVDEPLIALPSRDALPRLNDETRAKQQRLLETMFWEARVRQFAGRPLRLAVEVVRHFGFVLAVRGWDRALRLRRALLRAPRVW